MSIQPNSSTASTALGDPVVWNKPYRSLVTRIAHIANLGLALAALVSLVTVLSLDMATRRTENVDASMAWARALAVQVESAIVFDDRGTADEILKASATHPHVLSVLVSAGRTDRLLAVYPADPVSEGAADALRRWPEPLGWWATELRLEAPVLSRGESVGTVHALVDLRPMWRGLLQKSVILLISLLAAAVLAGVFIRKLLRQVLAPVSELTRLVQNLSRQSDFSVRISVAHHDEVGLLSLRVNQMLAQIQERDALLAANHDRLLELKQQADQASRAKGDFLAHMSHEIRTPLSTINISTYLALKSGLDERQRHHVDRIRQAADHLQSIVNDVLDFSKIEAGKVEIESVPFAWNDVLQQLDTMVGQQARDKGLQFTVTADARLPAQLLGDPVRIAQVLVNLAHNAVKFTATGGVDVRTDVLSTDGSDLCLRVSVTDTGVGIPSERMDQLFRAFQQLHIGSSHATGGTGLGLVICRQLVTLMGGDVGVSSKHGQGSCFWFTLKLVAPLLAHPLPGIEVSGAARPLIGMKLLLVDDSASYQQVVADLLRQAGARVVLADSGQAALQCLAEHRFDAVLMDIQMPGMNGLEAIQRIREHPEWASLPVVAMTANARLEERDRCLRAGMTDFVAKPFHPPALICLMADLRAASLPLPEPDQHTVNHALQFEAGDRGSTN